MKTDKTDFEPYQLTVSTDTLAKYLGCGRTSAIMVGDAAGARFTIGKRVLWKVDLIKDYLKSNSSVSEV